MAGPGLTTAPFWHCTQGTPSTQPSLLPLHAALPGVKHQEPHNPTTLPAGSWNKILIQPCATHLCSALLPHLPFSFAPPVLCCFSCRPCFLLPLDHTSYSTFALSLLFTALSIMHFHKILPSPFNFYVPSCLLQTALDLKASKEGEKGTKKLP